VIIYQITLRDRETQTVVLAELGATTQTVVGYYNGAWTTDRRRALGISLRAL
jgi:hypothetical protein